MTALKNILLSVLVIVLNTVCFSQSIGLKTIQAVRCTEKIVINGNLDDEQWSKAQIATGFIEESPVAGNEPKFNTEVKLLYDNRSIYIGAYCYDNSPDSIVDQLGERDNIGNADVFQVEFDTYAKNLDAYSFSVSASGVQEDYKYSDDSFNAVWNSAVRIVKNGWVVEIEIPYSAIRFPKKEIQQWKIQFSREIRRYRQELQWAPVPKDQENPINFWGTLDDIKNIEAPLRLSFTPYLAGSAEHFPYDIPGKSNFSPGFSGGVDMKLGLNESFTLDMTLLPDFSQTRSDNVIKNLSAFETVFEEKRPFFQEGTELFNLSDLFYSRRIGGEPLKQYEVYNELGENEVIENNPDKAILHNVTKMSGRNKNGLGIGVLNAITGNTYASIDDTLHNVNRKILTDPSTNYNIIALHQNLKNNSSFYLINTNVTRSKKFYDANVSSIGLSLYNKKNSYNIQGNTKLSYLYGDEINSTGYAYFLRFSKTNGNFKFRITSDGISPDYEVNDLGVNFVTNILKNKLELIYNKYNPFWILNEMYSSGGFELTQDFNTLDINRLFLTYNNFITFSKSYTSAFINLEFQPNDANDYYESRTDKVFKNVAYTFGILGISTDYRKAIAVDSHIGLGYGWHYGQSLYRKLFLSPILRLNDKLTITPEIEYGLFNNQLGFASYDKNWEPYYGSRNVQTLTNVLQGKYIFKNNLALTLRVRHYWAIGEYNYYADLDNQGYLVRNDSINGDANFNFNAFNVDLVFSWQFAPGSFISVIYKNSLQKEEYVMNKNYLNNLQNIIEDDQLNVLTIKCIYYLDAGSLKRNIID